MVCDRCRDEWLCRCERGRGDQALSVEELEIERLEAERRRALGLLRRARRVMAELIAEEQPALRHGEVERVWRAARQLLLALKLEVGE